MKLFMVIFLSLLSVPGKDLNAQEWKKFVPLKTTRTDVEAILGPAEEDFEVTYRLKDGKLSIEYSSGPCTPERKGGWNVPKDVVVSLHFSPRRPKKLSELKLDMTKFRKVINEHLPSVTYYINDEDGITYSIQQGRVDYVEYRPSNKYDDLYCKPSSEPYFRAGITSRVMVFPKGAAGPQLTAAQCFDVFGVI